MRSIQLDQEIMFGQHQVAVRALEAVELEIQENGMPILSLEAIEGIEQGWQKLHEGKGIASVDVHKRAGISCTGK